MVRPIPLDLKDGKKRLLKFEADGILLFEENFNGKAITEIIGTVPTLRLTLLLLQCGLVWQDQAITLEDVKSLYDDFHERTGGNYLDLLPPLVEAVSVALLRPRARPNGHDEEKLPNEQAEAELFEPSPTGSPI